jgi:transposase-like protein
LVQEPCVSELCEELDEEVERFRNRQPENAYMDIGLKTIALERVYGWT